MNIISGSHLETHGLHGGFGGEEESMVQVVEKLSSAGITGS